MYSVFGTGGSDGTREQADKWSQHQANRAREHGMHFYRSVIFHSDNKLKITYSSTAGDGELHYKCLRGELLKEQYETYTLSNSLVLHSFGHYGLCMNIHYIIG
jgi:hypothetical protein